jgi:hypothetical protein
MLLGGGLDYWVMKRLSRRRLLLCLWPSITGTRAGAMDDRVQLRMCPVLVVLLRPLLESRMFGRISTTQGVTAICVRTHVIAARVYAQSILRWIHHSTIG